MRKLLGITDIVRKFLRIQIENGLSTSFWQDPWTIYGSLLRYVGLTGPRSLRIPLSSSVSQAVAGDSWLFPGVRLDRLQQVLAHISTIPPPSPDGPSDSALWKYKEEDFRPYFSSSRTWNLTRTVHVIAPWSSIVWFPLAIPRHAFLHWQVMLSRLPTKDRLQQWGITSDATCRLCDGEDESHQHLFFGCTYASHLWRHFGEVCWADPPSDLVGILAWLSRPDHAASRNRRKIVKRLFAS
ncbi:PREDICTED: uncharacterized protein LOC104821877 [Tarenaya hassleriana]|uniref:uncharacterized protein LOC104821877 n=1 Tax=Tarenaya hassleriana TaxID=28532 RepID=UPI00053C64DF|nr:PREDICTED: uncharacterized protein LOC104821877 [Tarenaya hassleriana]